jgi:outer membrane receptor protein involved in Fe transport
VNEQEVEAKGLELEAQMRLKAGLQGLISYAWQRAEDVPTGKTLVNSPAQMTKLRLSVPGSSHQILSLELLSMSSRRTLAGDRLKPATTANVTMIVPVGTAFELTGGFKNLFNVQYADPAADTNLQDSIAQNGRTLRVGLTWKFWSK